MNNDEEVAFNNLVQQVQKAESRAINAETQISQMSSFQSGKEPNIVEYQLDVSPTLNRVYHLLSGHIPMKKPNGEEYWEEPTDDRLKILSDYGVKQIMNHLAFIINPNTLLSNFTDEQIEEAVRNYSIELADLIHNRYEHFFYYPSPEELYEKCLPIIQEEGMKMSEEALYKKCVQWSEEELKMKFRHYPMIITLLEQTVHATLLRALKGEERESLRKQLNIHQSLNSPFFNKDQAPQKGGFRNPFSIQR